MRHKGERAVAGVRSGRKWSMSTIVKADATGTVTLPAELCRAAGVAPGADLVAEIQDGRIIIGPAAPPLQPRRLGTLKGTVQYMAPDFDAPLEDFKDYMG
jgi:bifunctional DNA-binding transcriptional regulator/antitoxin component of YhaV-PrlF toxin-antitoxin module